MPKRGKIRAGRRPPRRPSPIVSGRATSAANTTSVWIFIALSDAQLEAIRSTRTKWPDGIDCRREIDRIGQDYRDAQAAREVWLKKLQGNKPAKQLKRIQRAAKSTQQLRTMLAELSDDDLLDSDFPYPDLESPEYWLEMWCSDYDVWVRPFEGKSNPIQAEMEWRLLDLWKKAGGKLSFRTEREPGMRRPTKPNPKLLRKPGTPYGPLIDFLTHALQAVLGRTLTPSGIAGIITRHRKQRPPHDPFLMYAMRHRITGS